MSPSSPDNTGPGRAGPMAPIWLSVNGCSCLMCPRLGLRSWPGCPGFSACDCETWTTCSRTWAKTNLVEENGETVRFPRVKSRDIRVVQQYMNMLAMQPTSRLFLVTVRVFLNRMKNGWQEVEFHDIS